MWQISTVQRTVLYHDRIQTQSQKLLDGRKKRGAWTLPDGESLPVGDLFPGSRDIMSTGDRRRIAGGIREFPIPHVVKAPDMLCNNRISALPERLSVILSEPHVWSANSSGCPHSVPYCLPEVPRFSP